MRLELYRCGRSTLPDWAESGHYARFGEEVLVLVADDAPRRPEVQELRANVGRERLHLVIQHGQHFRSEHPRIPVLYDGGRYLVVEMEPLTRTGGEGSRSADYRILPMPEQVVVFEHAASSTSRTGPPAWVQALVDTVQQPAYEADLNHLVSFHTRRATSPEFFLAADWASTQLTQMGYAVTSQRIAVGTGTSRNVIADRAGRGAAPRDVVLVTAHLDSINHPQGPAAAAPGADDNGSGSAGLLQMARSFRQHSAELDLRFILFTGEEEGLFGSQEYVRKLSSVERSRIRGVVNMDMIGGMNQPAPSVLLEGGPVSGFMLEGLRDAAASHTSLAVKTSLLAANSDHVPFLDAGVPAVLTIEGEDSLNTHIHSGADTIDRVNFNLALEIVRMNVAFVANLAGRAPA